MGIYRGPGGSGDATNDASSETRLAVEARDAAIAAKVAAETAQAAAELAETNAETAETNAETAETNAETAEANAETAEANAEAAQAAAEVAQAAAEAAQTAAELAETNAETAETNAETAASLAQDWATKLSTPVSGSDYSAKYNANLAAASASAAQTAETNAETAQAAAEAARDAALSAYDNFDDRYLGPKSSDPSLDNDGNALVTGALYFNTTSSVMKVYTGSAWVAAYVSAAGVLLVANNLSDVASVSTARTNLGLGTAATTAATDYATAAQGAKADTALQPAAIGVTVQGYDSDLAAFALKTAPTGDVVGTSDSQTLTNKTIALGSNTVSGTLAQFNTAVTDADLVSIAGTETLTNKTLTSPTISGGSINNATVGASTASTGAFTSLSASGAFSANGGATLGDASGDALTINSSAVSIPNGLNFDSNTFVIDASNNRVGVGTASPAKTLDVNGQSDFRAKASIQTTTQDILQLTNNTGLGAAVTFADQGWASRISSNNGNLIFYNAGETTERMRIDSSGNVGIGTSSPSSYDSSSKLAVVSASNTSITVGSGSTGLGQILFANGTSGASVYNGLIRYDHNGNAMSFFTNGGNQRMIIDSSGNLLVGTTSQYGNGVLCINTYRGGAVTGLMTQPSTNANYDAAGFRNSSGTLVGYIGCTASATSYVTSSDYRLKDNIAPMTGALAKVSQLKPCTYTWKSTGEQAQGFIAHELAEVVPDCVTGEKDAVETYTDEDGVEQTRPKYQGIDTSFLVATLTAAIQEQQAIITDLKARIETLENK